MNIRKEHGIAIVSPSGWLMGGRETDEFERSVREIMEEGCRCCVINLGHVAHMNSMAIGRLVGLLQAFHNRDGRLRLCSLEDKIHNVFVVTKLALLFEVFADEKDALRSFADAPCANWGNVDTV